VEALAGVVDEGDERGEAGQAVQDRAGEAKVVVQGRSAAPGAISLRDGRSPQVVPVWVQEVGRIQFWRTRNARLLSCSVVATAKENAPETGQRASAVPFNAFITGSTKGIGLALAKEFLQKGDNVTICSQSEEKEQLAPVKKAAEVAHGVEPKVPTTLEEVIAPSAEEEAAPTPSVEEAEAAPIVEEAPFAPVVEEKDAPASAVEKEAPPAGVIEEAAPPVPIVGEHETPAVEVKATPAPNAEEAEATPAVGGKVAEGGVRAAEEEGDRGGIPRVDHQERCGDGASLFQ
jgi:hypothetical protein